MKKVIRLTSLSGKPILIGVDSIIIAEEIDGYTEIASRHAMVTKNRVKETVDEIYQMINN